MTTFEGMGLAPNLLASLKELGFESPTTIQEKAIPTILNSDQDLIGLAQTGTGKTAAFGLPLLQELTPSKQPQALVLCPTRELCLQITKDLDQYSKFLDPLGITAVYGGTAIGKQIKDLKRGSTVVVGTPGRLLDLINRGALDLSAIQWTVLDEADEMLSMGFKEELDAILATTPANKRTLLFSATMPKGISRIASRYMDSPEEVVAGERNQGNANVKHQYALVQGRDRYQALTRFIDSAGEMYSIIFCRTKNETREVADQLRADLYEAEAINGDLSQYQRDYVMDRFRKQRVKLLVATDVAARGIDVENLTHIINYNLPEDPESYLHRSGRTGRAGKTGIAIALVAPKEQQQLKAVEKQLGQAIERVNVPSGQEVFKERLQRFLDQTNQAGEQELHPLLEQEWPQIEEQLGHLTREQLIRGFLTGALNQQLDAYQNAYDLNAKSRPGSGASARKSAPRKEQKSSKGYTRLFMNLGKQDQLTKKDLIALVNQEFPRQKVDIGDIQVLDKIAFFEIDHRYEDAIRSALRDKEYNGRSFNVELAYEKS
jgi:ATP-dependent RNA helicase DeaD